MIDIEPRRLRAAVDDKIAVVFPGQGSQEVGMLSEIAGEETIVTETFGEASDSLGYDLWQLVPEGPAQRLGQTENTQPALLPLGLLSVVRDGCWRDLQSESTEASMWHPSVRRTLWPALFKSLNVWRTSIG